ncbi:MAG: site-2 protease family protein [bacterium]
MSDYAKLRSDLVAASAEVDGATVFNIKDPITGSYFRLREPEYWLINQLDGKTSYEEVANRFREKFNFNIDAAGVTKFVALLEKLFFLDDGRAEQAISRASYNAARGKSFFSRLLFIKLKGFNPGSFLDWLTYLYRPFHNKFWFGASMLFIAVGFIVMAANSEYFYIDLGDLYSISSILVIVISLFIIISVHEFAHAVICRYYGGEVREIGFLLLYFQPCFYSDLSDAWLFKKKSHRLAVTFAGPVMQLILFALAVFLWRITVPGIFINEVARVIVVVCWVTMLFNFNPLIKLDGYYLLSDWVDIPNLRKKAFEYLGYIFKKNILGWPLDKIEITQRKQRIYLYYSLLALAYSLFLLLYLFVIVAKFLLAKTGGWGLLLFTIIIIYALRSGIGIVFSGLVKHLKYMRMVLKKPSKIIIYLIALGSFAIGFFIVPMPHRVSGEVDVRPIAEFSLLLNEFGLLESKITYRGANPENKTNYLQMTSNEMAALQLVSLVKDGQEVSINDTLAILVSNQVTKEIIANIAELEKFEGQLALLKSPPKEEEIKEAEAEVEAANLNLAQLEKDLAIIKGLFQKDHSSKEEYDQIDSEVKIAEAEVANKTARLNLLKSPPKPEEEAVIKADINKQKAKVDFLKKQEEAQSINTPINGVVKVNDVNSESILSILDSRQVEILVPVPDFNIKLIELNQPVTLKLRSYSDKTFKGYVAHIPLTAYNFNNQAYFPVSVIIENGDNLLQKGMTGYAKIEIGNSSLYKIAARKLMSFIRVEFWSWW